jgi:isopenicillin N synthase-like dioxygenase
MSLIKISYSELTSNNNFTQQIQQSFGEDGLGAILITDIPKFKQMKMKLLTQSKKFGELPELVQSLYENKESLYAFGWSRGKEKMKGGKPDFAKGSYYANPICDEPTKNKELIKKYPAVYSPNIWPKIHIPTFESNFKFVGHFMYHVGLKVIKLCDNYLKSKNEEIPDNYLYNMIKESNTPKARLLHYYEQPESKNKELDGACGWHLDHGGLTVLTKSVYLDSKYNEVSEPKDSGLYIKDRHNKIHHIVIPENSLLCQIGEIFQILSGGYLRATPHCVRSITLKGVTRETFPVFIDIKADKNISLPKWSRDDVLETKGMNGLDIPKLKDRYEGCKTYCDFGTKTYKAYYE